MTAAPAGNFDVMVAHLEVLVRAESPSDQPILLERCAGEVADIAASLGVPCVTERFGDIPLLSLGDPGSDVLLLGHLDTVHARGSLAINPWRREGDRLYGPGVLDMKAGLVIGLHAIATAGSGQFLVNADEEIGSPASRGVIETTSSTKQGVLVLEAAAGTGLKVARKGSARFTISLFGVAAHAGLEAQRGANALLGMASVALAGSGLADGAKQTTVTPTLASAGSTVNTVPSSASVTFDVRAWSADELDRVREALALVDPTVPGVSAALSVLSYRPPFESSASAFLFERANALSVALGQGSIEGSAVGGGSDGNFTAAGGVRTLDGLGGVGEGPHTPSEWVSTSSLVTRTRLVSALIGDVANWQVV